MPVRDFFLQTDLKESLTNPSSCPQGLELTFLAQLSPFSKSIMLVRIPGGLQRLREVIRSLQSSWKGRSGSRECIFPEVLITNSIRGSGDRCVMPKTLRELSGSASHPGSSFFSSSLVGDPTLLYYTLLSSFLKFAFQKGSFAF